MKIANTLKTINIKRRFYKKIREQVKSLQLTEVDPREYRYDRLCERIRDELCCYDRRWQPSNPYVHHLLYEKRMRTDEVDFIINEYIENRRIKSLSHKTRRLEQIVDEFNQVTKYNLNKRAGIEMLRFRNWFELPSSRGESNPYLRVNYRDELYGFIDGKRKKRPRAPGPFHPLDTDYLTGYEKGLSRTKQALFKELIKKPFKKLKKYVAVAGLLIALTVIPKVYADDIYKGCKGSTDIQVDARAGYIRNDKGIETITNTLIMKYWADANSFWAFTITPYKFTNNTSGTGDMTIGAGPRIAQMKGKLNLLPYVGANLPTGQLGNNRFDEIIGLLGTYKTIENKFEADLAAQYTFAGKKNNAEQPNEFYLGAMAGGGSAKLRGVGGFTHLKRNNEDYLTKLRAVGRYTFSKNWHVELAVEKGIASKNIAKESSASFYIRWNIPNNK